MKVITEITKNLIYDVGMHKGEDTDYYLKKGFKVVAFEADPDFVAQNKVRFKKELKTNQLKIIEGVIIDKPHQKTVIFYKNLDKSVWGTAEPERAKIVQKMGTRIKKIDVDTVNFAEIIETCGMPYYMKIDIEKSDVTCLNALQKFKTKPSYLSIESEDTNFDHLISELNLLSALGYEKFAIVPQANMHKTKVPEQSSEGRAIDYSFPKGASGLFGSDLRQEWVSESEAIATYEKIFERYRKFGDSTIWQRNILAKAVLRLISILIGYRLPGWYDTHAKHAECRD